MTQQLKYIAGNLTTKQSNILTRLPYSKTKITLSENNLILAFPISDNHSSETRYVPMLDVNKWPRNEHFA